MSQTASLLRQIRRALNKWAIDNLMTHICALALAVDKYEVDTYDLREDLKLEPKM